VAHNKAEYARILSNIKGVMFLGTPHRGANLAVLLSTLLTITLATKVYVKQMAPSCETVTEINESFYDRAKTLQLVSFWESTGMRGLNDVNPVVSCGRINHLRSWFQKIPRSLARNEILLLTGIIWRLRSLNPEMTIISAE